MQNLLQTLGEFQMDKRAQRVEGKYFWDNGFRYGLIETKIEVKIAERVFDGIHYIGWLKI